MVASRTPIFPSIEVLKWLIDHTDGHKCLINNENGRYIGFFLSTEVQKYYKLRDPEEQLNTDFVVNLLSSLHHEAINRLLSWNSYNFTMKSVLSLSSKLLSL